MSAQGSVPAYTVELRVHGVSGTPPEDMLMCAVEELKQTAGDESAGFYRRRADVEAVELKGIVPEAYSWGGLTSGSATRALWLLLLPFLFVNLAHWMLPPATNRFFARWAVRLLRLLGLSLTLTLLLAAVAAIVDVTAWQCGHLPYCGGVRFGPFGFLTEWTGGQRVAFAALPLAALVWVVLSLGKANPPYFDDEAGSSESPVVATKAGHTAQATQNKLAPESAVMVEQIPLADKNFWVDDKSVHRLRLCHVTAWNATLGAVVLNAVRPYVDGSGGTWWCVLLGANLGCLALALLATLDDKATARGGKGRDWFDIGAWVLVVGATAALVGALLYAACAPGQYPDRLTSLAGLHATMYGLLLVQIAILAALFLAMLLARLLRDKNARVVVPADDDVPYDEKGYRPTLRGFTAFFVAAIALLGGGGLSAGLVLVTAQFFGEPVLSEDVANAEHDERVRILADPLASIDTKINEYDIDAALTVPSAFALAAIVFVVLALLLLLIVLAVVLRIVPRRARADEDWSADDDRLKSISRTRAWAWLPDIGAPILAGLTGFALVAFVPMFIVGLYVGFGRLEGNWKAIYDWLASVATVLLAATAGGIVSVTVLAFRNRQARRTVGILWDVITFWPRANHPLTPPCYAQRTVPDLRVQTRVLGRRSPVVVSAHSQGSIIAAAALLLPSRHGDDLADVALLTYGSPLRRLFGRNFPAYFGVAAMQALHRKLPGRWINLWAASDPIGGWVFTTGSDDLDAALVDVDFHLTDVETVERGERGTYPPINGHSGFRLREAYTTAVARLDAAARG